MSTERYFIGLMTGTSLDGVDATLIVENKNGYQYCDHVEKAIPSTLRQSFLSLLEPEDNELERAAVAAWQHALLSAEAVHSLLEKTALPASKICALGSHGQTLRHAPHHQPPYSIQIQNPALLAEKTGIDVIADFRSRDLAAGGEGAPLAPLFQRGLLGLENAIIINIGGIANISFLEATTCSGYDTGPGNGLLDSWIARHCGKKFDHSGNWARQGNILPDLLKRLLSDPYFSRPTPKSSGRDYFSLAWLESYLQDDTDPASVQRTLLELTAQTISAEILRGEPSAPVFLAGGGAKNCFLSERIAQIIGAERLKRLPLPVQALESAGFAWLAAQFVQRRPLDLARTTGGKKRILGALYPA